MCTTNQRGEGPPVSNDYSARLARYSDVYHPVIEVTRLLSDAHKENRMDAAQKETWVHLTTSETEQQSQRVLVGMN